MRNSEPERTAKLSASLPLRIALGQFTDGRRKSYFVRHGPSHARKHVAFETERDRNDAAEHLAAMKAEHGNSVLSFDATEWGRYLDFRTRCAAPLPDLEKLWLAHCAKSETMLISDAVPRYLELRLGEDVKKGTDTWRHMDLHLRRLVARWGSLRLDQLNADALRLALSELVSEKGETLGALAKRSHRRDWNTFLKRCVTEEWCSKNPCLAVKPPKVEKRRKPILTPEQAFQLFKANAGEDVIGRLALEAFGGFRASSAERLRGDHIKWDQKGLELTKEEGDEGDTQHKSGALKYRQGHPAVLWQWLEVSPVSGWSEIDRNNYGHRKGNAFLRANVKNTGNVLRHSFASYLLAITKSYALVGYLMQHTKASTTEIYEGAANEEDGRMYLAITPAAVRLDWAAFRKTWRKYYVGPVVPLVR